MHPRMDDVSFGKHIIGVLRSILPAVGSSVLNVLGTLRFIRSCVGHVKSFSLLRWSLRAALLRQDHGTPGPNRRRKSFSLSFLLLLVRHLLLVFW